jgi:hypothetical protein
VEGEG